MRALVTGGAGFIGSHIVEHLLGAAGAEVAVLDNFSSGRHGNLEGFDVALFEGDLRDPAILAEACRGVDTIFHLAAMVSVIESMDDPQACVDVNVSGMLNLMRAASQAGCRKIVFSSSCAVYGSPEQLPVNEATPVDPLSPYALTKYDGEKLLATFAQAWGLEYGIMRYFNVYGPRQNPQSQYAAAIPIFAARALAGKPLTIYGDGRQTRDFIFVKDVVQANLLLAESDATGPFNVGTGVSIEIRELAETIVAAAESSAPIEHAPSRAGEVRDSRADIAQIRAAGFEPRTTLMDGLRQTLASLRAEMRR